MRLFLLVIGVFYVMIGTLTIFATNLVRKKFFSKFKDMDFRKWSAVPIAAGVLFLMAAPASQARLFITLLGILALAKGFYGLLGPKDKIKKQVEWWLALSNKNFKIYGIVILALGIFVLLAY